MSDNEYIIEQFTLNDTNFPQIIHLVDSAFNPQTKGGTIHFDEQTLRFIFGSPFQPPNLMVRAIYRPTGEIVGFTGGIPRTLAYREKRFKFGIPSFQAVHPAHQRKGLAVKMNLKMIDIAKQEGFEGGFALYEPEEHGIDAVMSVVRDHGLQVRRIFSVKQFIARSWNIPRLRHVLHLSWIERIGMTLMQPLQTVSNPHVRLYQPSDGEQLFSLMHDHIDRNELSIVRDHDDFLWYLNQPGVLCMVHESTSNTIDGFILAWKMNLAGYGHVEPFGWLDIVHIYHLSIPEATALCQHFCLAAHDAGWIGIQTPFFPYFDPKPFRKARFLFYPKILWVNIYLLKPLDLPEKVSTFYFDWR